MANGNGETLTNGKLIGLMLTMLVLSNSVMFWAVDNVHSGIEDVRKEISVKAADRYTGTMAARDKELMNEKFSNVVFRFQQNEKHIDECLIHARDQRGHNGN